LHKKFINIVFKDLAQAKEGIKPLAVKYLNHVQLAFTANKDVLGILQGH